MYLSCSACGPNLQLQVFSFGPYFRNESRLTTKCVVMFTWIWISKNTFQKHGYKQVALSNREVQFSSALHKSR
jgi:hypothetical protein